MGGPVVEEPGLLVSETSSYQNPIPIWRDSMLMQVVGVHLRRAPEKLDDVFSILQKSAQKNLNYHLVAPPATSSQLISLGEI